MLQAINQPNSQTPICLAETTITVIMAAKNIISVKRIWHGVSWFLPISNGLRVCKYQNCLFTIQRLGNERWYRKEKWWNDFDVNKVFQKIKTNLPYQHGFHKKNEIRVFFLTKCIRYILLINKNNNLHEFYFC